MNINKDKKLLSFIIDFLELEFNTMLMEAKLPKDKLIKVMKKVERVLEKRSSTIHKELQSLVDFFSFIAKIVYLGQTFL